MADYEPVIISAERAYLTVLAGAFVDAFPEFLPVLAEHLAPGEFLVEPDVLLGELGSSAALRDADRARVEQMAAWWRDRMARHEAIRCSIALNCFLDVLEADVVR